MKIRTITLHSLESVDALPHAPLQGRMVIMFGAERRSRSGPRRCTTHRVRLLLNEHELRSLAKAIGKAFGYIFEDRYGRCQTSTKALNQAALASQRPQSHLDEEPL